MRLIASVAILLLLIACSDPARSFAAGLRNWCKTAENCTEHGG